MKFFDPAALDLTVWQVYQDGQHFPDGVQLIDEQGRPRLGGGVWIKEVGKESPFDARLRAGDVITATGEVKTSSKPIFRKVLRRKLAEGGPTLTFKVRRGKETLDVPIPVKD